MESFYQFLQRAEARGSRSTVMTPLGWLVGTMLAGLAAALTVGAPVWVLQVLVGLVALAVLAYLSIYVYFAKTNSDALRSEKFSLSKMAMEKSLKGDSLVGLVETDPSHALSPGMTTPPPKLGSGE